MKFIFEKSTVLRFVALKIIVLSVLIFTITGCQMSEEELNAIVDQRLAENKIDERLRLVENCLSYTAGKHQLTYTPGANRLSYGGGVNTAGADILGAYGFQLWTNTPKVKEEDFLKGTDTMSYWDCDQLYEYIFSRDDRVFSDLPDQRYQDFRCEEVGGSVSVNPDPGTGVPRWHRIEGTLHCGPHNSDREEE